VGYPDSDATVELLLGAGVRDRAALISPVASQEVVRQMTQVAACVEVDRSVARYVRQLAEASRELPHVRMGLSARGCLAVVRVAKTWAAADGRTAVVPADVTGLAEPLMCHRLLLDPQAQFSGVTVTDVIQQLLDTVPPPLQRA